MSKPLGNENIQIKNTERRTTLTIDQDTKLVFDWAMNKYGAKSVSKFLQHLLLTEHEVAQSDREGQTWAYLLNQARADKKICEKHGRPLIYICSCGDKLCTMCDIHMHIKEGHIVQNYCRIHNTGYGENCLMCEKERWESVVEVKGIIPKKLMELLNSKKDIAIIDVRDKKEWDQGHLPQKFGHHNDYLRLFAYREFVSQKEMKDQFTEIKKFLQQHHKSIFIVISHGSKQNVPDEQKESGRGFLVAAHMKCLFGVEKVCYLKGGWYAFQEQFPAIIEK